MLSIALLRKFRRACLMLALKRSTAAFALDCHGKKKNAISLQHCPRERQQPWSERLVRPVGFEEHLQFAPLSLQ